MPVNLFQKIILNRTETGAEARVSSGIMGNPDSGADKLIHLLENYAGNFARAPAPITVITPTPLIQASDAGMFFLGHTVESEFLIQAVTDWANPPTADGSTQVWFYHSNWLGRLSDLSGRDDSAFSQCEA